MSLLERAAVKRVQDALVAAGSSSRVRALDQTARTAKDAAAACEVPLGAIVKSLAFASNGQIVIALVAGDRRCDMAALQKALDLPDFPGRADPADVKAATGFTIGGVAPMGYPTPLPVAIDQSLDRFSILFAAAGHPHCVFPTSFSELRNLTGGRVASGLGII